MIEFLIELFIGFLIFSFLIVGLIEISNREKKLNDEKHNIFMRDMKNLRDNF